MNKYHNLVHKKTFINFGKYQKHIDKSLHYIIEYALFQGVNKMFQTLDESILLTLNGICQYMQKNEINKENLENILKLLLPNKDGELLVGYRVSKRGNAIAMFVPKAQNIILSVNQINLWLDNNTNDFMKEGKIKDYNTLRVYLLLFIILHEIEHSYQYLIGKQIIEASNPVLVSAYRGLFDLLNRRDYIVPRPIKQTREIISLILYKLKENLYLLERNANIESMHTVSQCALYSGREDISQLFMNMRDTYMKCGYINGNMGSIEETYRMILMYDKYKKFYKDLDLSEEERVRYGFGISDDTRKKILKKI